jgi:hypothetical protein
VVLAVRGSIARQAGSTAVHRRQSGVLHTHMQLRPALHLDAARVPLHAARAVDFRGVCHAEAVPPLENECGTCAGRQRQLGCGGGEALDIVGRRGC